ncbi:hypothetical protein BDD12DRAFT_912113 [Trichophaea hybrida]|nr:hypothetical protein BDD12DRAFT_912113 [Trichophaea hybrida]
MSDSPIRTIDELVRTRAVMHANTPVLSYPSDARLAVPAYLHLLEKTECSVVLVQPGYQKIMEQTRGLKHGTLDILPMVHASYITTSQPEYSEPLQLGIDPVKETDKIGWIIHSSGSTGFPKPVGQTHRSSLTAAMAMNDTFREFVTLPLFHSYSLSTLINSLIVGRKVSFYNRDLSVTGPNVLKAIEVTASEVLFTVPYVVKLLAETEGAIAKLRELRAIVFGGASCPESIALAKVLPSAVPYARWEPKGDNLYQLVVLPGWGALVAVIIKSPGTEFPRTDKGTAIRTAFLRTFDDDIQSYYDSIERNDTQSGKDLSEAEIRQLVCKTVLDALLMEDDNILKNDMDFFSLKLDSLIAINIHRKLLQEINTDGKNLSSNIVFEKPNVDTLAHYLSSLNTGTMEKESLAEELTGNTLYSPEELDLWGLMFYSHSLNVLPYIRSIVLSEPATPKPAPNVFLAHSKKTHLLDHLTEQQKDKIIALPADLSQESFGLPTQTIGQIIREVTTIIHGAWSVNFTSFEQQHIREVLPKLSEAIPMGYAQAKLVTEHICQDAAAKAGIAAHILRVGQIVGDTHFGMWNATEAVPLTIQSATTIGALPMISNGDEDVSWIPVDTTANTVVDLSLLDKMQNGYRPAHNAVFHVCHPSVLRWNRDVLPALKNAGLEFEAVDQHEWVKRLEVSEHDGEKNPPIKLLDFFRKKYGRDKAASEPYFETKESCRFSPSLRNAKEVDAVLIGRFLRYWKEECW